jgi:hypothetical protein
MTAATAAPPTDGSDLVAQPKRDALTGAEPLSDLKSFGTDIDNLLSGQFDGIDTAIDGAAVALDFLGARIDPLGTAISAGVGWIIEHVSFLREPFDELTGDPQSIDAVAETWKGIGERLAASGEQYESALHSIENWDGTAAADYRAAAEQYVKALAGVSKHANNVATGITVGGLLVASGRGVVLTLISSLIEKVIIEALAALASSWFTFGASIAAAATAIEIEATFTATDCEIKVTVVVTRAGEIGMKMAEFGEKAAKVAEKLDQLHKTAEHLKETAKLGRLHALDEGPLGRGARYTGAKAKDKHDQSTSPAK